jgi:hypothetical protein
MRNPSGQFEYAGPLPQDVLREDLYRFLRNRYDKVKFAEFLSKPCKHGEHGVCEKCDEDVHRVEGYWPQEDSDVA